MELVNLAVPALSWLAAASLTFWRSIRPSITAFVAISISPCSPISSNVLSIDPYLTLPHTGHVQSQRIVSSGSIKISLTEQWFKSGIEKLKNKKNERMAMIDTGFLPCTMSSLVEFELQMNLASTQQTKFPLQSLDS